MRKLALLALAILGVPAVANAAGLKVGLSLPTMQEERWGRDRIAMEAEAKKVGIDLRVQVTNSDAAKQIAQCENLLSQGIKVLIIAAHDGSSASRIVEMAAKAKVPVISYDRLIVDSPLDYYYLSFDNKKVGALQGEYLKSQKVKGNLILLAGSPTDNNAKLFRDGAVEKLKPLVDSGDVKVVMDQWVKDWQPIEAQKLCEQALTANANKIDAVLAPNDGTAGGCIQALAAQKLAGKIPITGQDAELAAARRIIDGTQSMTIFKDTRELGKKAIEMALELANGKTIDTKGVSLFNNKRQIPSILLEPYVVTKENIDNLLIKSGYLKKEQLYKK